MSSKRGRKRNDSLPPNRARDVQRAFRARRAAHLQALEQRVSELEEENSCLRQALNLPQANREPLGKGPTGKDKPKQPYEPPSAIHFPPSSRESSSADSPTSERDSASPALIPTAIPSRATIQEIQNGTGMWTQTIVMHDDVPQYQPVSAPPTMTAKDMTYSPTYSTPRSAPLASIYMYPDHTPPAYSSHFEQQQRQEQQASQRSYPYPSGSQQTQGSFDGLGTGRDVPPAAVGYPPQRRTAADYSLGGHFPHLPTPIQMPPGIRLPSPPRALQELPLQHVHGHHSQHDPHAHHHRPAYSPDGNILGS
ncbi:hypothetical protein GGX14DRAFT_695178 [Mycena pura]|uniref:BZIP domain-containing protein n=1 Tax=Mycena pura TaxID=153505 RepID=A0AAD6VRR1_9AGAR|nr:hypothetical protein GGX14DRAFT_695178 [Mycena pura]